MKIIIDKDLCTGEGLCEEICPEVFRIDEDKDIAVIIKEDLDEIDEEGVSEAVESCPNEAIIIRE
jgi:ferredoxin